ncbi:hypothetical protein INS49_013979 [Diaporthe citri]|uniref:uncharacterized protein n=1 Tax=Diaporthe citri TaxID=83186 RepID=UPI001C826B12|nr:uncharacterized protein INS49_013979 [Diaporthe citri]KAG6358095.1 hypothetical protein INS49_013979 [Diaporthe citri]
MKTYITALFAGYLAIVSAAPAANDDGCDVAAPVTTSSCTTTTATVLATNAVSMMSTLTSSAASVQTAPVTGTNVQAFTGTLGGAPPPVVSSAGDRPFSVNGDTFVGSGAALGRSCDVQHNACARAANSGQLSGGVSQCDQQNNECHAANNLKKRHTRDVRPSLPKRAALDLGSCSNANILFEAGLDGRNTNAFIAANQQDFNHGSALNIAVIAGFICQRLGSPCNAPSGTQQSCAQASSAAVAATQDQSAADAWNAIMGDGSVGGGAAASAAPAATAAPASATQASGDDAACDVEPEAAATPTSDVVLMTVVTCS